MTMNEMLMKMNGMLMKMNGMLMSSYWKNGSSYQRRGGESNRYSPPSVQTTSSANDGGAEKSHQRNQRHRKYDRRDDVDREKDFCCVSVNAIPCVRTRGGGCAASPSPHEDAPPPPQSLEGRGDAPLLRAAPPPVEEGALPSGDTPPPPVDAPPGDAPLVVDAPLPQPELQQRPRRLPFYGRQRSRDQRCRLARRNILCFRAQREGREWHEKKRPVQQGEQEK